jgi:osmoprotectant transport system substrate-binding protein
MRTMRSRALAAVLAGVLVLGLAACGDDDDDDDAGGATEEKGEITVGSTDFTEQQILGNMYALVLEDAGFQVEKKLNVGPRETIQPALQSGDIDVYPEYANTLLEFLGGDGSADLDEVVDALRPLAEEKEFTVLEPSEAVDRNALAVLPKTSEDLDISTTSDLADHDQDLVLGGPPECPERPLCLIGLKDTYGLEFKDFKALDAGGPLSREALDNGDIDVAVVFSSLLPDPDWVVLDDDKGLQGADNVIPAIRTDATSDEIEELLNAISEKLTTDDLVELNLAIANDKEDPEDVARGWLEDNDLLPSS